jgi:hypothetical protein
MKMESVGGTWGDKRARNGRGVFEIVANILDKVSQRVEKAEPAGHDGHGGGLAAGDDQRVALGELRRGAHLDEGEVYPVVGRWLGLRSEDVSRGLAQQVEMLDYAALQGENADGDGLSHCGRLGCGWVVVFGGWGKQEVLSHGYLICLW